MNLHGGSSGETKMMKQMQVNLGPPGDETWTLALLEFIQRNYKHKSYLDTESLVCLERRLHRGRQFLIDLWFTKGKNPLIKYFCLLLK